MTLKKYQSKRDFKVTDEPMGKKGKIADAPIFCVQKHAASHLHYDFRLEYKGVLLSWAVPKGPSLNPKDKRLAIHVEDHPYDYKDFEGTIPKGEYGGGTVMVWDKGTYSVPEADSKKAIEKKIGAGLEKGHLEFTLHGTKLQGGYSLVKIHGNDEKSWLLIKKPDGDASTEDITNQDRSVQTQRSLEEIAAKLKRKGAAMPKKISPMLATLIDAPFDGDEWLFEIKWDGYRALTYLDKGTVEFKSRTQHDFKMDLSSIAAALQKIPGQAILDGELVILDADGRSHFQDMQNYQTLKKGDLFYAAFDLLFLNGEDLRERPLVERKELLKRFVKQVGSSEIIYSDHVLHQGIAFFKAAEKKQLEGIMGKRMESTYISKRSSDWIKVKTKKRQEVVVGGFTAPRNSRHGFGALLVGLYEGKKLLYRGHVGGGFSGDQLKAIHAQLKPLIQENCPFATRPKTNEKATWVKPKLVCEVSFTEWTQEKSMRHPIFEGLRTDKPSKKVADEKSLISHPTKVYWPEEGYTKEDLANYYTQIAPYILPYLKNRPMVLHRFPDGITGNQFYQKEIAAEHPKGIKTVDVHHEERVIHYLVIDDLPSLLYAVNLGCIEMHPFLAHLPQLEKPDFCVIDLDPEALDFEAVMKVAHAVHDLLDELKLKHFCKTTGGRGIHICMPLKQKYTFEQSKQFAELIAHKVHERLPDITSLERSPAKRQRKVYLDYLQNRFGQTIASAYSVRPKPHAPVSTPLLWEEVRKGLDPTKFTIETTLKRLEQRGDLFKGVFGPGISIEKALKKLGS